MHNTETTTYSIVDFKVAKRLVSIVPNTKRKL